LFLLILQLAYEQVVRFALLREEADRGRPFQVFASQPVGDRLFIDAILHDRPVVSSFYDGLMAQVVIEAAFESHRTGAWVEVPDPTGTLS